MIFLHFRDHMSHLNVFSLTDIKKVYPSFDSRRLNEWTKKGYINKLRNGWYFFPGYSNRELSVFFAANRIYSPSYVSMESALSYHGIIPEGVYAISSVTTLKTNHFSTPLGEMYYHAIKPDFYWGYHLDVSDGKPVKIASPEKACLDLLYLRAGYKAGHDISDLRIDTDRLSKKSLLKYLKKFDNRTMESKVEALLKNQIA